MAARKYNRIAQERGEILINAREGSTRKINKNKDPTSDGSIRTGIPTSSASYPGEILTILIAVEYTEEAIPSMAEDSSLSLSHDTKAVSCESAHC